MRPTLSQERIHMQTNIPLGDPQAIRRYSTALAVDYARMIWWKRFIGTTENSIVHQKTELQQAAGDTIQFDLSMRLRGGGTFGDDILEGKEEALNFMIDEVKIDQVRHAVDAGGRMTRKRTLHDLRVIAKSRLAEWFAEWCDEVMFCYASGTTGAASANEDKLFAAAAFANNPVEAPDTAHIAYGGDATSKASLEVADKMSFALIQKVNVKARTLNAYDPNVVAMKPVKDGARDAFVVIMSEEQAYDLRTSTGTADWLEIAKQAGQRGTANPIYTEELGRIGDASLHKHTGVRRFYDAGAGSNIVGARALYLGRQALTAAYGSGNTGTRMMWDEEQNDYGARISVAGGMIFGAKKTRYKPKGQTTGGSDFGVIAIDTAAARVA
jgi:N4-gp56 family major capsid protein